MKRAIFVAGLLVIAATPALAVQPTHKYALDPRRVGVPYETLAFPSARDSVKLTGWWFDGPEKSPVVVLCPRGKGNMADLLPSVREFAQRGFTVMTFDLRDFGPTSASDPETLKTLIFASRWVEDTRGALSYARARAPGRFVFAWGQDLGGPLALAVGAHDKSGVDAIAVEGLFRTVQEQLRFNGTSQIPEVPRRHRMLVDGSDEPISTVPMLRMPLFVVIAAKDDVTPPAVTRDVVRQSLSLIERWTLPSAGHDGAELSPGYFDRVAGWFKHIASSLPPPQP